AEFFAVKECLSEAHFQLVDAQISHQWPIEVGAMIETPAAALLSEQLAQHVDFLSLGTNDLTQYVLSAERGNAALTRFSDALHPAVLEVARLVVKAAERYQIGLSLCGETASDPIAVPVWLALGVRSFSLSPDAVAELKELVRKLNISDLNKGFAEAAPEWTSLAEVRRFGQSFIK
ncbi:MAG: hypothetical protein JOY96_04730, partial [Verrucomicrobia bacterium]|nr:hypothetical protein [Verrucomicrobiota bacterium]